MSDTFAPAREVVSPNGGAIGELVCPECQADGIDKTFQTALALGAHRSRAHQVAGKGSHKAGRRVVTPRAPKVKEPTIREQVTGFYTLAADLADMAGAFPVAEGIRQSTPAAALRWEALAKQHDWVHRFWADLGGAAGWPALAAAHVPIGLAIFGAYIAPAIERRRMAAARAAEDATEDQEGSFYEPAA